jgi:DHA2 family multidrug resistance protein
MSLSSFNTEVPKDAPPKIVNPWIVAISVMFATFMEILDTTVVNVSLPHIAGSLSSSINEATWVLTSYLVANAIILPITGWLANHIGRKRLLMISVIGFTSASFFCGLAFSLRMLIIFRLIQGAAGGALQPLSQAVLLEAFPPEKHGRAMAFWGLGIVVAPILGPVLGGWLTDSYSWRWVFYINIPVGIASIIMTKLFIFDPLYIRRREGGIDYWGLGMLALGIGALQVVLDQGQQEDWLASPWIRTLFVVIIITLPLFLFHELRTRAPVVNLRVFRDRTFATGTFLMTILGFVLYGSLVLLPIWLQTLLGYPSLQAGEAMAPRGLGSFLAMPLVGILLSKYDPRKFLTIGVSIAALTLWQFSRLNLNAGYWDFFWPQLIQGVSLAFIFVPLTTITMGSIPREHMGNATSIFNLLRNLGGSFGIAGVATLLDRFQQTHVNLLVSHITPYRGQAVQAWEGAARRMWLHGSPLATARRQGYAAVWGEIQRQAAVLTFLDIFRLLAIMFVALIPFILIMKKPVKPSGPVALH